MVARWLLSWRRGLELREGRTCVRMRCFAWYLSVALTFMGALAVPAQSAAPLSNDAVIAMVQGGLDKEVVIAKIRQVSQVSFQLEVDDLLELKKASVPQEVISAMLDRSSASPWGHSSIPSASTPGAIGGDPWAGAREDLGIEFIKVALLMPSGATPIKLLRGEMTSSGFLAYRLQFMDYPGLKARARTTERRPTLLVRSASPVTGGHYFFAKLEADEDDGIRSLKVSSARNRLKATFGGSDRSYLEPDHDWVVEFDVVEESPETWRVTPRVDLEPGEYGFYIDPRTMHLLSDRGGPQSQQEGGLFDFGVD